MPKAFDEADELALDQAVSLVREVVDKHLDIVTTAIFQRFNEAFYDIAIGKKMLKEESEQWADDPPEAA